MTEKRLRFVSPLKGSIKNVRNVTTLETKFHPVISGPIKLALFEADRRKLYWIVSLITNTPHTNSTTFITPYFSKSGDLKTA